MTKEEIKNIHAETIFHHDRVCCICRDRSKKNIQIHHIDENHSNDDRENLSVLCLDCHSETLLKGNFSRKLSPEIVSLYRDEWLKLVIESKQKNKSSDTYKLYKKVLVNENVFINQFNDLKITPLNATFYFNTYFFETENFPTLIVTSDELTEENGDRYRSILKSYLLCSLGYIMPSKYLSTNTIKLVDSKREVIISDEQRIKIPDWFLSSHKDITPLHMVGVYYPNINEIQYLILPAPVNINYDYRNIKPMLASICDELIEKYLDL